MLGRKRRPLRPPALVRAVSFNVATMALLDACQAGTRPHRIELPRQIIGEASQEARSIGKRSQDRLPRWGGEAPEDSDAAIREPKAEDTRNRRQHETLDEQFAHDTPTACAEREVNRHIARALGDPRQQEIRCVGAGDEQHEGNRAEERDHDSQNRCSDSGSERLEAWCCVPIAGRILFGEGSRDARQLRRRLLVAHARSQATDAFQQAVTPRRSCVFRECDQRYPDVRSKRKAKALRHDADDDRRNPVNADSAPQYPRIGEISGTPDHFSEYHDRCSTRPVVRF